MAASVKKMHLREDEEGDGDDGESDKLDLASGHLDFHYL